MQQDPGYSASPQPEIRFWRMQHNIAPAPMMCSSLWLCIIEPGNTHRFYLFNTFSIIIFKKIHSTGPDEACIEEEKENDEILLKYKWSDKNLVEINPKCFCPDCTHCSCCQFLDSAVCIYLFSKKKIYVLFLVKLQLTYVFYVILYRIHVISRKIHKFQNSKIFPCIDEDRYKLTLEICEFDQFEFFTVLIECSTS
ncbi:hypothetical protein BpHYR1_048051 [Brachionus plicatilis]|uniref:Uncharacterized protein n=1 Tax=Brachionus plicatilis TaxID=10195 RepID=A0A3M7RKD0_BRAPC|nr:hypothetical protein BpHYR1_048051 [Brachionus plicatilis]